MQRGKPLAEIDAWLHRDTMAKTLTVIGSFVSPYVRKVLACMNLKGLNYEVDPITPFYGNDEFERLSPLRRIPVLIDGDFTCPIPRSSVRTWMRPMAVIHCSPLTQRTARLLAGWRNMPTRASATCSSGGCSTRRSSTPSCGASPATPSGWNGPSSWRSRRRSTISRQLLPADGFLFGDICAADIAVATFFRNAAYAGFETDRDRWPRTAAFVDRTLAHPAIAVLLVFEEVQRGAAMQGGARPCSTPEHG